MVNIFETRFEGLWDNTPAFVKRREELMTEEEIQRVDWYLGKFIEQRGSIQDNLEEWEEIDLLCSCNREDNGMGETEAFVNVMVPNIEGQIASMTNYHINANVRGKGVGDQKFAKTAEPIIDLILEHNRIRDLVKESGRRYVKFGNVFVTVGWDEEAFDGMGMPVIQTKMLSEILPDKKVRNPLELDKADYIIEDAGQFSIHWAEKEFGEEKARAIQLGNQMQDFQEKYEMDDDESFTLLRVWTKLNESGNLQLILMSACGILLEESDENEPYYGKVFNKYPIFYAGLYPREGEFYRYGDGKLLKPIQTLINKIYDEVLLSIKFASQGRTYIDPTAKVKPSEFSECDPSKFIVCRNPSQNVVTSRGAGINDAVYALLGQLFQMVQEVTRFSTLMTGQEGSKRTATEAGILMQQGATGVDDKKADISSMLSDAVLYAFGLCLDNWNAGVALRVADDPDEFMWIDVEQMRNVPKMIPASNQFVSDWRKKQPRRSKKEIPKWMELEVEEETEEGVTRKSATGQIMLDVKLDIGEGMPTNKVSMYNILLSLSQLMVIDEVTLQPAPLLTRSKVVSMLEDYLGIKIEEDEEGTVKANGQPLVPPQGANLPPINQDANVPNANVNGQLAGR